MRRGLALILCLALAAPAWSAPFVSPDPFTVSGRFELAKAAEGPLKSHLRIAQAAASPEDAKIFMVNPAAFDTALAAATTASLRNFGYLAGPEASEPLSLQVRLDPLEVTPDKDGVTVVARFRIETPDGALNACVPKAAEAKYRALAPVHGGDRQRALGIVALVAFAAIGYNASQLVTEQFQIAKADQAAANARRERIEGESVSPEAGDRQMAHFAAVNATQLALADFVRQLGRSSCATAASPTAAPAPAVSPAAALPAPAG
jgi:hypothetical protein